MHGIGKYTVSIKVNTEISYFGQFFQNYKQGIGKVMDSATSYIFLEKGVKIGILDFENDEDDNQGVSLNLSQFEEKVNALGLADELLAH